MKTRSHRMRILQETSHFVSSTSIKITSTDDKEIKFDVILIDYGTNKINVIYVIKSLTGLVLQDSKKLVDSIPIDGSGISVLQGVSHDEAKKAKNQLENGGAKVQLKETLSENNKY